MVLGCIDCEYGKKTLWKLNGTQNCLVTNILQDTFCVQQKNEVEWHEHE